MSLLTSSEFHLLPPVSPPPLPTLPFSSTLFDRPLPPSLCQTLFSPSRQLFSRSHTRKSCLPVSVLPSRDLDILPPWVFLFPLSPSPSFLSNMPAPCAQHLATHIPQFISYVVLNIHPPWKRAQERILKRKHGDFAAIFIREKGSDFGVFSSQSAAFIVLSHTTARRCPRWFCPHS